jgi:hypothetical protein
MAPFHAAQAQTTPWPVKEFEVEWEWNKTQLEKDLRTAATFFEQEEFRPPNLKIIELVSPHPQAGMAVHPIHANASSNRNVRRALGEYDAGKACANQNSTDVDRANQRPEINSDQNELRATIPLVQSIALPHELFHAVQNKYPSFLEFCENAGSTQGWSTATEAWFREGMADAMALEWLERNRSRGQIDTYRKSRVRGWRNYHAPLTLPDGWESYGYDARVNEPVQEYKTSSFWRYLGPKLIRAVLEFDEVTSDMEALDWLDEALQEEWVHICMKAFNDRVPTKPDPTSCKEASKYAGLYLVYPMFITKFAETERNEGGLDVIFSENDGGAIEERGSGRRQDGCIVAEPSFSNPIDITLPPVAAECLRVPAKYQGKLFVHARILGTSEYENLILGWNGCVQSLGSVLFEPDVETMAGEAAPDKTKVWPVNRDVEAGINGCERPEDGEDLLLVFSNIAPKASETELVRLQIMILQDEG